jgi:nitrate/nitrite-specific signal transduction histidine kinase
MSAIVQSELHHGSDNGSGIDSQILATGKSGHFELEGMRSRAANIGAKLTITNLVGGGVEATLVVPGTIIFKNSALRRS